VSDDLRLAVALNGYGLEHHGAGVTTREVLGWEDLAALGRLAERLGYERIFAPEIGGWESFTLLSGLAGVTDHIGLATGVVPLDARRLETLAMAVSSMQERVGGRFILGVGSRASIDRTRAWLRDLRVALGTTTGDGDDGHDRTVTDWPVPPRATPVFLAALGPRMVELGAASADGVLLNWCTPERVAEARAAAGQELTIAVYVRACLSHVDEHALEALQVAAARYLGLPPYAAQLDRMGLGPEARAAREALEDGAHPRDAVPESLVNQLCVRGARDLALARLREYRDAGADLVVVYPVPAGEAVSSITGTLIAVAPDPALEG
jgi:alkanesulfonate monooxygenase SsuD/methylene tetrahydromethanopterin reductase-like flavin-dependent oxidoreductase (luciferase family)